MNNEYKFILKYDGPSLESNAMDVSHLAPALLSLNDALSSLNTILNKDKTRVNLQVRALNKGSFSIDLLLAQDLISQVGALLTGAGVQGYCAAYTIVRSIIDLLSLKKWLAGRKPDKVEISKDSSSVTFYIDNRTKVVTYNTYIGYNDSGVNAACSRIAEPLKDAGIESMVFVEDGDTTEFDKSDIDAIFAAPEDKVLTSNISRSIVMLETAALKDRSSKWKVKLGESQSVYVSISDEVFMKRVDDGIELFGKGDVLLVDIESTQVLSEGRLQMRYDIKRVLEHKRSAEQLTLF